jgi:hypothetical protein
METENPGAALSAAELEQFYAEALTVEAYWADMFDEGPRPPGLYDEYLRINRARATRVRKSVVLEPEVMARALAAPPETRWLVVTEHWCGDSAQVLPVLDAIAAASAGRITLKVAFRDHDVRLIDAFLTNGGRSIPKVIALGVDGSVEGVWGPRPTVATELVRTLKANPETAPQYGEHLHKWYATDKTLSTQREAVEALIQNPG